jgi:hypothetical protein
MHKNNEQALKLYFSYIPFSTANVKSKNHISLLTLPITYAEIFLSGTSWYKWNVT